MVEQEQLHEKPAHRHPHHVGARHFERVEHRDRVAREVGDAVRLVLEDGGGTPGVAVVVADDAVMLGELGDEGVRPHEAGRVGTHHEQQRLTGMGSGGPDVLGPQADTGRDVDEAFHGVQPAGRRCPCRSLGAPGWWAPPRPGPAPGRA
jgi:hypothetical protein